MNNCPTCGAPVASIFDHIDEDCEEWTHKVTWYIDGVLHEKRGTQKDMKELRHFMLNVSPLKRDNISKVLPL